VGTLALTTVEVIKVVEAIKPVEVKPVEVVAPVEVKAEVKAEVKPVIKPVVFAKPVVEEKKKVKKINHMNLDEVSQLMKKMKSENQQGSKKYEQLQARIHELTHYA
jgi:hypothetical protein